jgi:hypothetical protein
VTTQMQSPLLRMGLAVGAPHSRKIVKEKPMEPLNSGLKILYEDCNFDITSNRESDVRQVLHLLIDF